MVAVLLVVQWVSRFIILKKDREGGQESCIKTSTKNSADCRFGALKMPSCVQESLGVYEPQRTLFLLEDALPVSSPHKPALLMEPGLLIRALRDEDGMGLVPPCHLHRWGVKLPPEIFIDTDATLE